MVKRLLVGVSLVCASMGALAGDRTEDLDKAAALIKAGKPAEAYQLLKPFEDQRAGERRYDYLLAIAALDSGHPDTATFIFERILAADPNFAGARLDMARAYFQLGDYSRARDEFNRVMALNPPPLAKATVAKYLAAIENRQNAARTRISGYVEFAVGRDTNVNASPNTSQVIAAGISSIPFTLNPSNIQTADNSADFSGGVSVEHRLNDKLVAFGGVDLAKRANFKESQFDHLDLSARVGVQFGGGDDTVRVSLLGGRYFLDTAVNRDSKGANVEWRRLLSPVTRINVFSQYTRYRFPNKALNADFNQAMVGAGWIHALGGGNRMLFASVYGGNEQDTNHRADGGKGFYGVRLGGQMSVGASSDLYATVGAQVGDYDTQNVSFATTREDHLYDGTVGLTWKLDEAWSVKPQLSYTKNRSNIDIYAYDRTELSLALRRDFK